MTVHVVSTATPTSQNIFGVPVGLIMIDQQPITEEKYTPGAPIDTLKMAQGTVGAAAGLGAVGLIAGGARAGAENAAVATVISLAVAGSIAGVTSVYKAFTHQRVTYITIRNTSTRTYTYLSGYNNSGHATVPDVIPCNSVVRMAFHNKGENCDTIILKNLP